MPIYETNAERILRESYEKAFPENKPRTQKKEEILVYFPKLTRTEIIKEDKFMFSLFKNSN